MGDSDLGPLALKRKTGTEPFCAAGRPAGFDLLEFWQWSSSDLVDNTSRGVLAEFIVAKALGIDTGSVRVGWASWDLETADHVRIEVKSAAYIQSWGQQHLSTIQFVVPKRRAFDGVTNTMEVSAGRHAHVYVFALLAHKDKASVDPLDLDQWSFYVLPTGVLDERVRTQHSITLRSLESLVDQAVNFAGLARAVQEAASAHRGAAGLLIS